MRVLVTGAAGFVGTHVAAALRAAGHTCVGLDSVAPEGGLAADICDPAAIAAAVAAVRPDACIHLAGVAFVPDGDRDPRRLIAINVDGTGHVATALLRHAPGCRMLFASSAMVYGPATSGAPLREDAPIRPNSAYSESKAAAEALLMERHRAEGLNVVVARPGNHTGPGQSPKFVVPAFATSVLAYATGRQPAVRVGNLDSVRDFTDVRDVVSAYLRLLFCGQPGWAYNIGSGTHLRMGEILARLAGLAQVELRVEVDPALYRPTDATPVLDTARLRGTGWLPAYDFNATLRDVWQAVVASAAPA